MSGLPDGWADVPFGSLNAFTTRNINPAEFPNEDFELYSVPIFPSGKPEIAKGREIGSIKQLVVEGDVLVCKINPRINRVWMVGPSSKLRQIASSEWIVVRAHGSCSRYLRAFFSSPKFREDLCKDLTGVGGSLTRAQPKRVATYAVPLAPVNEQKRIADRLDVLLARADAARERLDRVPGVLKRFRLSVLGAAASGELTAEWRGGADASWDGVALRDVASDFSYGSAAKSAKDGKVPVLRMGNIQKGMLDWNDLAFTSDKAEIKKYKLSTGDVLFNRTNSPELVGKTAVFRSEREAIYAGYLIRVRCSEKLLPEFLSYCLNGPIGLHWRWEVKTDGVSQSNINATKLAAFKIGIPPIDEQREIVRRVDALFVIADRIQKQYEAAREKADRLVPALLAKAFRGELVSQDLNDEPAPKLLERVHAGKAKAPMPVAQVRKSPATVQKTRQASESSV